MEQEYNTPFFNMDANGLGGIIARYPWFVSARVRRTATTGEQDDVLGLALLTKPWPAALLHPGSPEQAQAATETAVAAVPHDDIIDKFLASGSKKVVPDDNTPTDDVSEGSGVFVPDEDMDTEELARIYREQGLDRMADEVADIVDESIEESMP